VQKTGRRNMTQDEIIKLVEDNGLTLHGDIEHFAELVAQHEREACAKIADEWAVGWPHPSTVIAERIRARKQA
jgi:hypothetical protein